MLSYRHAFHAGNHADVLKHAVLSILLRHFTQKEKPFTYVDTHAGAGLYRLDSEWAQKTFEAQGGIVPLLEAARKDSALVPEVLADYVKTAAKLSEGFQYPGSPEIARLLSRAQDSLILCELHNTEITVLSEYMKGDRRVHLHHRNGFEFLSSAALSARSCVLIDPSYETGDDYGNVTETVQKAFRRNSTAVFAVWYPLLTRRSLETASLVQTLQNLCESEEKIMRAELFFPVKSESEHGLYGSGMLVLNAPWKCAQQTQEALAFTASALKMECTVK